MKKIFLLAALLSCLCVQAQEKFDVLLSNQGEQTLCTIKEITDTEVRYIRANDSSGILYSSSKSNLNLVILKDGTRLTFNEPAPTPAPMANQYVASTPTQAQVQTPAPAPVTTNSVSSYDVKPRGKLVQISSNRYQYNGEYLTSKEVDELFKREAPSNVYKYRRKASLYTGAVFTGIGLGDALSGLILHDYLDDNGISCYIEGGICTIIGTCLIARYYRRCAKSIELFNAPGGRKMELGFTGGVNSFGVRLNF